MMKLILQLMAKKDVLVSSEFHIAAAVGADAHQALDPIASPQPLETHCSGPNPDGELQRPRKRVHRRGRQRGSSQALRAGDKDRLQPA